ncbi:hypothetical protein C8J57DRAFT_1588945, partial [Mycena rebaudengoi]
GAGDGGTSWFPQQCTWRRDATSTASSPRTLASCWENNPGSRRPRRCARTTPTSQTGPYATPLCESGGGLPLHKRRPHTPEISISAARGFSTVRALWNTQKGGEARLSILGDAESHGGHRPRRRPSSPCVFLPGLCPTLSTHVRVLRNRHPHEHARLCVCTSSSAPTTTLSTRASYVIHVGGPSYTQNQHRVAKDEHMIYRSMLGPSPNTSPQPSFVRPSATPSPPYPDEGLPLPPRRARPCTSTAAPTPKRALRVPHARGQRRTPCRACVVHIGVRPNSVLRRISNASHSVGGRVCGVQSRRGRGWGEASSWQSQAVHAPLHRTAVTRSSIPSARRTWYCTCRTSTAEGADQCGGGGREDGHRVRAESESGAAHQHRIARRAEVERVDVRAISGWASVRRGRGKDWSVGVVVAREQGAEGEDGEGGEVREVLARCGCRGEGRWGAARARAQ